MPGSVLGWEDIGGRSYLNMRIRRTHSSTGTQHPRIQIVTRRVTWGLLSQTRASWTGLASFDERSSSSAVCFSIKEQRVGVAKSSSTQGQPPRACRVVGCSPSPEPGVSSYRYMPGDRVRNTERVLLYSSTSIWPATLCLLCGVQNLSFGQLWDRTELLSGFVWPGHF